MLKTCKLFEIIANVNSNYDHNLCYNICTVIKCKIVEQPVVDMVYFLNPSSQLFLNWKCTR